MAKKKVEFQCQSCDGTGLYSGMGEREGTAVVCYSCNGTGKDTFEYEEFTGRKKTRKVTKVFQKNIGIVLGNNSGGGLAYKDWWEGKPFPKYEDREYTCPAWWWQNTDYKRKPNWDECYANLGGSFSQCPSFKNKSKCWERFDKEKR